MAAQHTWWLPTGHIPDGDQRIRAATDQLRAIWTPVEVVEGGRVALHDAHALPTFDLPQPQGAIVTATEQVAAVGGEGQAVHITAMSLQHGPQGAELPIPQPDGVVKAATGQRASIRTPGHALHPLRMPRERLETAPTLDLPQLDGAIPARAGEDAAVGGKGQAAHPDAMPGKASARRRLSRWVDLPQPDRAREVATGEQVPIRAPGQRDDGTGMRQFLQDGAQLRHPRAGLVALTPTLASSLPSGEKARHHVPCVCQPDQSRAPALDVPQLDAAILASTGKRVFIRAEGEGQRRVGMGLPGQV